MSDDDLTSALFADADPGEFDPLEWMFTTRTIAGARTFLAGLGAPGEVWEYLGRYYPVRAGSADAGWLRAAGASLIPPGDDVLHHELDQILRINAQERAG